MNNSIKEFKYKNLIDMLNANMLEDKGITLINSGSEDTSLSYKELKKRALIMLHNLNSKGVKSGYEVVFQLEDNKEFIITFWACILGGIIPVPVAIGANDEHRNKLLRIWNVLKTPYLVSNKKVIEKIYNYFVSEQQLEFCDQMSSKLLDFDELCEGNIEGNIYTPNNSDIAFIQFSSGSTGDPKGVVLTHENLITNISAIVNCSKTTHKDSTLGWMPLTHDMGLIGFHLSSIAAGVNQYIMSTVAFIRNPMLWMNKVTEYKATVLASPNFGYKHFLSFYDEEKERDWDLSHVRLIFNGAEPISAELSDYFYNIMGKWGLKKNAAFPVYGLAEASLAVSFSTVGEGLSKINIDRSFISVGESIKISETQDTRIVTFVDLGYPVDDCFVRICDWDNNILSENAIGQIQIKGKNVTKGYYNNEIETRRILSDDGWLNTGDIGFMRNGRLAVTGRAKDIIFVNGQNFYPHDLERIAAEVNGAELGKSAICGAYNNKKQKEEIIVFILYKGKLESFKDISLSIKKVINFKAGLDVSHVIPIKKMPKTTSGKVQRYKLKEEYEQGIYDSIIAEVETFEKKEMESRQVVLPTNEMEAKLAQIWSDILDIENIGINDNFFELGGDSLKATYIAAKIYKELGVELPLNELFNEPTIRALAECAAAVEKVEYIPISRTKPCDYYPLSSAQKRMYVMYELDRSDITYNITHTMKVKGSLDIVKLEKTINRLIYRHESLRTYFELLNGIPVQKIKDSIKFNVDYVKLDDCDIDKAVKDFVKPFELNKAPLFRLAVIETKNGEQILLFDAHHIIFDGTSVGILFEEFIKEYEGYKLNMPLLQYKDYVKWQAEKLASEETSEQEQYWLEVFKGEIPVLDIPLDFPRPAQQSFEGDKLFFTIDQVLSDKLKKLAYKNGTSIYMLLLAAYYVLLNKYTGQEDIVIGTPTVGRNHPELHSMIGMFVNTLALRNKVAGENSFEELLNNIKDNTLTAFENQDYQFDKLVDKLSIKRNMGRNPLFDTMFVFQNMKIADLKGSTFEFEAYKYKNNISKFDITLFAQWEGNEIACEIEYCTKLFRADTIESISSHFKNILNEIADGPQKLIADIKVLSNNEENCIINTFNNTKAEYPADKVLHMLFEERAEIEPESIAVVYENQMLTYNELNQKSNQLARLLRSKGVKQNNIIAIMSERIPELVIAILGVLKAGAAYLPIDPDYPQDRISYMLEDSETKLVLAQGKNTNKLFFKGEVLAIDNKNLYEGDASNLSIVNTVDDLAYVIYTSGSTGKPKGTMLPHRGAINYINWAAKSYLKGEKLSLPLYTSISFDLTVTSIFTPLITGSSIIIYNEDDKKLLIEKVLEDNKVDVIKLTPAHLKLIKDKDLKDSRVKRLIVGGEQLETDLASKIYNCFNGVEIYNEYGPTEATVGCMIYLFDPEKDKRAAVPIGVPADNMEIYILDKYKNVVPQNTIGEMYIGGIGLAKGYLNRQDMTDDRFIKNPFRVGERMYKTGDLSRLMWDGNIEFIGRKDHQVKIRGYRIELGEIESKLLQNPTVNEAVVLAKKDSEDNNYLCAYVISDKEVKQEELRSFMKADLPEYMLPSYFIQIEKLPLTINGKVDTKALPEPTECLNIDTEYIAPANAVEAELAEAWKAVLGVEKVGIKDNYYSLGGDSIKAIQIASKLGQRGLTLSVKDILTYQTINDICINVNLHDEVREYSQEIQEGIVELLPIHHWFLSQSFNNPDFYNQSVLLRLNKDTKVEDMQSAFSKLIAHHDGLRLNYNKQNKSLYYNNEFLNKAFEIEKFDISHLEESAWNAEIAAIGSRMKAGFDIENSLLIKAAVIAASEERYLLITAHHLVIDGVSWMILLEDLFNVLEGLESGTEVSLPKKTASLRDWHQALLQYSQSEEILKQQEYWDLDAYDKFRVNKDISEYTESNANQITRRLEREATHKLLTECHKTYNTEINDLLLTALYSAVTEWTGNRNIVVELEGHGRHIEAIDASRTIGWFTVMYPVKLEASGDDISIKIKDIKEQLRKIPDNGMGYGLLKYFSTSAYEGKKDVPEIRFNYLGQFDNLISKKYAEYTNINTGSDTCSTNAATANVAINCMVVNGMLEIEISYNKALFSGEAVESFADSYLTYLEKIISHTLSEKEIHFTPSDFDTLDIGQDDLDSLFA